MSVHQEKVVRDADRFGDLHKKYGPRLVNSMTGVVRDREAAQEITAAAFAKAFEKRDLFRGRSSLYTWVHAIALNEARRELSQKRPVSLDALELPSPALIATDRLAETSERSEEMRRLQQALTRVPEIYRRLLVDHFVHGHPVKRIARRRQLPFGTVLSRIFTGKRLLRAAWGA
ncbi:MAG TPA: RNA polymerase sigma factor [Bryobacteraceae bacterium]|jgi:RNA polymerase sigma-70 factor (ECF subfamily)